MASTSNAISNNVNSGEISAGNACAEDVPSNTTTVLAPSGDKHTHTIIFLHGREDFGSDLAKYFFDSKASDGRSLAEIFPSIRWVFPTAKLRYSAQREFEFSTSSFAEVLKGEEIISQWFDVWDIKMPDHKKELMIPGLQESIGNIVDIIREEAQMVPLERIILGGISQGCATAILTLLSSGMDLGGFIGWCGWLPFQKAIENLYAESINKKEGTSRKIQAILQMPTDIDAAPFEQAIPVAKDLEPKSGVKITKATTDVDTDNLATTFSKISTRRQSTIRTPVFLAHSNDDEMVPFTLGEGLYQTIKHLEYDVIWKKYEDGGHWIHSEHGVDDMSDFLRKIINS